jgi:hypothetical protein
MTPDQERELADLTADGDAVGLTASEAAEELGVTTAEANRVMRALATRGLVVETKYVRKKHTGEWSERSEMKRAPGGSIVYVSPDAFERHYAGHHPNDGANYYVWLLRRGELVPMEEEGPYGPHDLAGAKTFARIGATEGEHDRVVSRGRFPGSRSFEIVRRYKATTGERLA